jgi:ribosomal protein S18 acetylase RimI-like enzyme
MKVVDVTRANRKKAGDVFRCSWLRSPGVSPSVQEEALRVSRQKWDGPNTWNRVVEYGTPGVVAGVILCEKQWRKRRLCIKYIAVDPAFQRRGVARCLLNAAKEFCKRKGFTQMWLFCHTENEAANATYKRFGFKLKRTTEIEGADGEFANLYEYPIQTPLDESFGYL